MQSNRRKGALVVAALILGLLAICGRAIPAQAPAANPPVKWEYDSIGIGDDVRAESIKLLNQAGQDGWELVTITRAASPTLSSLTCVLKRPKR